MSPKINQVKPSLSPNINPTQLAYKPSPNHVNYPKNPNKQPIINSIPNPYSRPTSGKCFKRNQSGHRSNEYPLRRSINIMDRVEDLDDKFEDADNDNFSTLWMEWRI